MSQSSDKDSAPRLVLVPTPLEFDLLRPRLQSVSNVVLDICGFGPVSSGIRAAQMIEAYRPQMVLLIGIAGRIDDSLEVGQAYRFTEVAMYGIGAGSGESFQTAGNLGWPQWWAGQRAASDLPNRIGDVIPLSAAASVSNIPPDAAALPRQLLTVCSASSTLADVRTKQMAFPLAAAEDMEGFSVAMACCMRNVKLEIVRGLSNRAGDRNKVRWKVHDALYSAATLATELLK